MPIKQRSKTAAELPSGGLPLMPPDLAGVAPDHVQARVQKEREQKGLPVLDEKGRRRVSVLRAGFGWNVITLPALAGLDAVEAKERAEQKEERVFSHNPCSTPHSVIDQYYSKGWMHD